MPRPAIAVRLRALPAAALAGAAAVLGGCGTPSDADQVRSTLQRLTTATARHDYATLCDKVLSPRLLKPLEELGLPCPAAVGRYLRSTRSPQLEIRSVRVTGRTAVALVRTSAPREPSLVHTVRLVKTAAGWRVDSL